MTLLYPDWKRKLIQSSGTVSTSVILLGDRVLELFWRDGCEPSISGLLDYAQSGLHPVHQARSAKVSGTSVMNQL